MVGLPATFLASGCHLWKHECLWPSIGGITLTQLMLRLSSLYSVIRASSVLTGSTTRRWGWYMGRRGYATPQRASRHSPLDPIYFALPLQALSGPDGCRRLRLPDFKTIGTWRWQGCQSYASAAFNTRKYSRYSFLLEAESTPRP
jgi:hypothetical protein